MQEFRLPNATRTNHVPKEYPSRERLGRRAVSGKSFGAQEGGRGGKSGSETEKEAKGRSEIGRDGSDGRGVSSETAKDSDEDSGHHETCILLGTHSSNGNDAGTKGESGEASSRHNSPRHSSITISIPPTDPSIGRQTTNHRVGIGSEACRYTTTTAQEKSVDFAGELERSMCAGSDSRGACGWQRG